MKNTSTNFSHAATIFPVKNVEESVAFYTNSLGFKNTFSWGKPVSYAVLKKGGESLHVTEKSDNHSPSKEHCALYIYVYDIDEVYQSCIKNEVTILTKPENREYKMQDFDIEDPDGYIITCGKEV